MSHTDPQSFMDTRQGKISHIDFDLDINFKAKTIHVKASYKMDKPVNGSLYLDIRDIKINKIYSGKNEHKWEIDKISEALGQRLHIEDLKGVQDFTIECDTSKNCSALQWMDPPQTAGKKHPYVYSQCQALHARSVFPCQDAPAIRFTYAATVRVPDPLKAVMAAERVDVRKEGQYEICRFRMPQPIPSYLFAIAAGNIDSKELTKRTSVYAEPELLATAAKEFRKAEDIIEAGEKIFGPYLWDRYDILLMPPSFPYGAMENPRMTFMSPTVVTGEGSSFLNMAAHELGHAWTGNLVTNATWNDIWLNEGWTVYAEIKLLSLLEGSDFANLQAMSWCSRLANDVEMLKKEPERTKLKTAYGEVDPFVIVPDITYAKGYLFLVTLERTVGKKKFESFTLDYINKYKFQSVTTEEFLGFLKKKLPEAYDKVDVQKWVYEPGTPPNIPEFESHYLDKIEEKLYEYKQGKKPAKEDVKGWSLFQIQNFIQKLPRKIPIEDCKYFEKLFDIRNLGFMHCQADFCALAIGSGYKEILPLAEKIVSTAGRNLIIRIVYQALAASDWGKGIAKELFEKYKPTYHVIAQAAVKKFMELVA